MNPTTEQTWRPEKAPATRCRRAVWRGAEPAFTLIELLVQARTTRRVS